jgi:TolB protein
MIYGRSHLRSDLQAGQVSRVMIHDLGTSTDRIVLESKRLIEAPNWTPDGKTLVVNSDGQLFTLPVEGGELVSVETGGVAHVNNDHVLSPDGSTVYFSAAGHLFSVPLAGGVATKISNDHLPVGSYGYFLHGISPDSELLAYVAVEPEGDDPLGRRNLAVIPTSGGADRYLSEGLVLFDGPEYSPDGAWLYYNSEEAATREGHSQIFRMTPNGENREQLTFDERVNWFPHLDPAGENVVYISYEPGTCGHPADVDVHLRIIPAGGGEPGEVVKLFGGQGTLNVNSWGPDGSAFAYVSYPILS